MKKYAVMILAVLMAAAMLVACDTEPLNWDELTLGDKLPECPGTQVQIHDNSREYLWIEIQEVKEKQYYDYIDSCQEFGYTIEVKDENNSFKAFNEEGYKLEMYYYKYNKELDIKLKQPMEMDTISWPTGTAGSQVPAPESTIGSFSYEYDNSFCVYVGQTDRNAYKAYIETCIAHGFDVDYSKGDDYYRAKNQDGWYISIEYAGNSIMTVSVSKSDSSSATETVETTGPVETTEIPVETTIEAVEATTKATEKTGMDPNFKAAMDSYEKFMDEYVTFMKKYEKNSSDWSLMIDYADFMQKYTQFCEDFEEWGDKDLNAAETAYYIEVQTRVNKKLMDVLN